MDILHILDHAHAIAGPVSFVEMLQAIAGKLPALKTEPGVLGLEELAPLNFAFAAGERFSGIIAPTAGAPVFRTQIRHADSAIHSAWGNQGIFVQGFHGSMGVTRVGCPSLKL
jgi:hypothetical protein